MPVDGLSYLVGRTDERYYEKGIRRTDASR
jgi:hypothetical protein